LTGALLGIGGAAIVTVYFFERPFVAISPEMAVVSSTMILVTVIIGYLSGRDVYRATPAEALRE
jgi:ABC-type antimicrobial peptide transport system permease subunit